MLNAQFLQRGYPEFYAGGGEPNIDPLAGDQSYLFEKNNTSDSIHNGRTANNYNYFTYKFDLPDGNDNACLHAKIRGQFILEIARDSVFSSVDLVYSNNPGDLTERTLNVQLKNILNLTADNLIYVRVRNSAPSGGNGGQLYDFWISSQPNTTESITFIPVSEEEIGYLWDNHGYLTANHQRFTDGNAYVIYRVNFDPSGTLDMTVANEYVIEVSSDASTWTSIFNAGDGATSLESINYNPFTGATTGTGATGNTPVLCPNYVDSQTNVVYVRISDADPSDGNGGLVQSVTINVIPEPTLIFSGLLLGLAFLRRK